MPQNTFARTQLVLPAAAWWQGSVIDFRPNANLVDFWHAPTAFSGALSTGPRKSGVNKITPSIIGADSGFNDELGTPFQFGADSTGGAGLNSFCHFSTTQTLGNGFRVTCPMPRWPDWQRLDVYFYSSTPNQVQYTASSDDPDGASQGAGSGSGVDSSLAYLSAMGTIKMSVKFASDRAGRTLTLDAVRAFGTSMGNFGIAAAALWKEPPTQRHRGGFTALSILTRLGGPIGSR